MGLNAECYYFCTIFKNKVLHNKLRIIMDLRTIGTLIFYAVLLGVAFWVGGLLEKNERKYTKYFKED